MDTTSRPRRPKSNASNEQGGIAVALGPIAAIAVAGVLARFRDSAGQANVVLALCAVVIAAAVAGRLAGAATAVVAALAFNFFHAVPYYTLRIDTVRDVVTMVLLLVIGVAVAEVSGWRRRTAAGTQRATQTTTVLEDISELVASGADAETAWPTVETAVRSLLRADACRFEAGQRPPVAALSRRGGLVAANMRMGLHGFALPAEGVSIPVVAAGAVLGHLVVTSHSDVGSSLAERRAAIAVADLYAVMLTRALLAA